MSDVTIVKIKDFTDWVKAQPDERPVDMGNNYLNDRCGCAMVQYGQEVLKLEGGKLGCGTACWQMNCDSHSGRFVALFEGLFIDENNRVQRIDPEKFSIGIFSIFPEVGYDEQTTFGELKKYL
jgi:hypothetical protein